MIQHILLMLDVSQIKSQPATSNHKENFEGKKQTIPNWLESKFNKLKQIPYAQLKAIC